MAKYYRMKDPVKHVKGSIGKFQTKHPYATALVEVPLVVGAGAATAERLGMDMKPIWEIARKIPVAGTVYKMVFDGVYNLLG